MAAKWDDRYDQEQLCNHLEESKVQDVNGNIRFESMSFKVFVVVLNSMVSLDKKIPKYEKYRILYKAALNVAKKGETTPSKLLREINLFESQFLDNKPKRYILLTSLSVDPSYKLKLLRVNDCNITFTNLPPKIFLQERKEKVEPAVSSVLVGNFPRDYLYIKISVTGKSDSIAAEKALDSLHLIRGIWNLFYNSTVAYRESFGRRRPVNKIILGPLHTLHFPNGKLATSSYWYEIGYQESVSPFEIQSLNQLYTFQDEVRKLLKRSPFRSYLEKALIRYTRALDLWDWETSYIHLWSLLEYLTSKSENEHPKPVVKRASYLFEERDYAQVILRHLKDYRNRAVHGGEDELNIEILIYQLKRFVEVLIEFQILNKYKFNSRNEIVEFLDSSTDLDNLNYKLKMTTDAITF